MVQQHKKAAASTAASSPGSSGSSSSSRSIHGTMTSAFLGVSSSTHSQSQSQSQLRRSSPSLYTPAAAPTPAQLPGHLASRGSAASGGSGSSSSQFHQISPSPRPVAKRRRSPSSRQCTHSLPSPFLSELSSICRMGTNIFGDLNAQEIMTQRPFLRGRGQQEQEMTRSSSSLTVPHHQTPIPSGELSGLPSASPLTTPLQLQLQQQQAQSSFSSLQPPPAGGIFSGFPLPASQSQPQQMLPSSTDPPSSSGFEAPVASQHSSTYLAPLPSWSTILQSSWCHGQPSSGDSQSQSQLPPLPPSLEIPQYGLPPLGQLPQNNGSSSTESTSSTYFVQPSSNSETYELPPLPESLQMPPPLLHQVKQEPAVVASYCLEPEIISLDNDHDDKVNKAGGSSSNMENSNPVPEVPKLILGGMDRPGLAPRPPASSSMSRRGRTKEHLFSEADIEMISKDKQLKEIVKTEPKRVRRILNNRENVARLKLQKANHFQDLERRANALKMECKSLSAEVQSRQEMLDNLKTEIREAQIKFKGLNEQVKLSEALNHQLQSEIERLKLPEINMVCANGIHNPKSS